MIMYETIFLSGVGGILGMIISALLLTRWSERGMNFSGSQEAFEQYGISAIVYPSLEPDFYFTLSFLIILTGIIASIYPARKAVRLNPVDALKTE